MATKRTPINRAMRRQITPAAVEAFQQMEKLRTQCTCPPRDWDGEYWKHEQCAACDEWFSHHSVLHDAVGAELGEWPCIYHPDARNPYPVNSPAARSWDKDRAERTDAFELYEALSEAAASAGPKSRKSMR
jgi:hypothetical protein